jgi:hypothetical protein
MSRLCPFAFAGYQYCNDIGSEAWVYGGVLNTNQTGGFPTANYTVDGVLGELFTGIALSSGTYFLTV